MAGGTDQSMISIRRAVKSFAGLERAKDSTREIA